MIIIYKEIIIEVNDSRAVVYEDTVRFRVEPEEGYEVESIDITDEEQNKINYRETSNKNEYEFTMPDTDVIITPKYEKLKSNDIHKLIEKSKTKNPNTDNPNTGDKIIIIFLLIIICLGIRIFFYKNTKKY